MKQPSDTPLRPELRYLAIPLVLCVALGFALVLTKRPTPSPAAPALPELTRTNLIRQNGCWYQTGHTNPFTGILLEYYHDGSPQSRSVISNGLLNGLSEGWYTNRQLEVREFYRTNYSDGLRTKWWPNGRKLSEATVALGKINGLYRRWYEDGSLAEEIPMQNGRIEGIGRAYYESGYLKAEVTYQNNQVTDQHTWKDGERKGN